jgi:LuxR family maltose regulon positive regulatory protein
VTVATEEGVQTTAERSPAPEAVLLETKLTRPRVRAQHVPRRALLDELRDAGTRRLTLVAAPPGFGKTTLLAEWAASEAGPVAWLSLDEGDKDPARFFAYLAAAVRRVVPGVGDRALAALRTPGGDLVDVVLPMFLNDLAGLDVGLAVVLDDYHVITEPAVYDALAYLLDHAPNGLRIIVATRQDPPLPLGRLRARGELGEVRAGDLRFSSDESSAFLIDALELDLSAADLERLQARTEGWPAALYLAALTLRGRPDASALIERFAGDDRYVVDYLTAEVLARQTPELRAFLLQTSILKRFCGPLCDAVTGRTDSSERLVELERSNLLLVPLDTTRGWYRYHHLFGELLTHELRASDREAVAELHRRASAWCRNAGLTVDACDHAIAGGDVTTAAEIVAGNYATFVDHGQLATVIGWLEAIPEPVAAADWLLCFAAGVAFANAGRTDEAERWLALAEQAPPDLRDGLDPIGPIAALAATLRLVRGDVGGTVQHARRALASGPAADPGWALGPQMVLASGLWWSGASAEAKAVLETATRAAQTVDQPVYAVWALGVRAAIALDELDESAAEAHAASALARMADAGLEEHPWTAMAHIAQGTLDGRRGQASTASEAIERGIALGDRLRAWQVIVAGSLALAEVRQRQHRPADARRLLARVRDLLASLPDPGDGPERLERAEKTLRLKATRREAAAAPYWELSPRELEVLRLLPSAMSQREIAAELYVSFNTVRTHTRVIFEKLGVTSRTEAVARARELGLL